MRMGLGLGIGAPSGAKPPVQGDGDFNAPAWVVANASAYWPLEESDEPRLDLAKGHTLSQSDTVNSAAGKVGDAASFLFDDNRYLSRVSTPGLQIGAGDFVLAAWAKPNDLSDTRPVVCKGAAGDGAGYVMGITSAGAAYFTIFGGDSVQTANGEIVTGAWHLIVARYSTANSKLYISVNLGTIAEADILTPYVAEPWDFRVGADLDNPFWYDGLIDELALFNAATALSSDDHHALRVYLYNGGAGQDLSALDFPPGTAVASLEFTGLPTAQAATTATAVITLTGNPAPGARLRVGTYNYEFNFGPGDFEFELGADAEETAANIASKINADTADTFCTAVKRPGQAIIDLTANAPGAAGNSISFTTDSPNITLTPWSGGVDEDADTLTVGGKIYTYSPDDNTGDHIDISSASDGPDVAALVLTRINADTATTLCTGSITTPGTIELTANSAGSAGNGIALSTTADDTHVTPFWGGA